MKINTSILTALHFHLVTVFSLMILSALVAACARPAPPAEMPTQPSMPVSMETQTEVPAPPTESLPSSLVFPHVSGDAGNFFLLAGETIAITWENAPVGADKYEFVLVPQNADPASLLGVDVDASDGVAISWTIPEHVAAELRATAYFSDGQNIGVSFAPSIYSREFPPSGGCSLLARNQPVEVYRLPDRTAEVFALLRPAVYARVLEIMPDGWYRIDASTAELYAPSRGMSPEDGLRFASAHVALKPALDPASGEGWVNGDKGVLLARSCPP